MAASTVQRALGLFLKQRTLNSVQGLVQVFIHLLRITVSFLLLPLDNAILITAYIVGYLPFVFSRSSPNRRRRAVLQDVHFYPKTILITGIETRHGLAMARSWYYEGHRVVGADITDLPIRSGESMSKTLMAFYHIPKSQYISQLLDIIHREKVDIWIPCSERATVMEDAIAKQVIESRTGCKCIHLDMELVDRLRRQESFVEYLVENDLPVLETHQVQSRDSIHKILHRAPTKVFHMHKLRPIRGDDKVVALPKRTPSLTYSEVSEIQISNDRPWVLQQQTRLGMFFAELLIICGHVKAIKICPSDEQPGWGHSRLDGALAIAIRKLMERFAMKGGSRMTGHLCLELMVDEEFDANSVRHAIHITGCTQGASAAKTLLQDVSCAISPWYLAALCPQVNDIPTESIEATPARVIMHMTRRQRFSFYQTIKTCKIRKLFPVLYPVAQQMDDLLYEAGQLICWNNWQFSLLDPLPWWWNAHIYQPLREFGSIFNICCQREVKLA